MNDPTAAEGAPAAPAIDPNTACGLALRAARESAGLSLDEIAQQLKLHPRQVAAIESGRFEELPGRTFVRGFLRNYARAVRLDPDAVLASLPDASAPQAITPTGHNMGEIRFDDAPRRSWSRWVIPLALVALVALAAVYEYLRPAGDASRSPEPRPAPASVAPQPPAATAPAPAADAPPAGTPLPNPVAPAPDARPAEAPAPSPAATAPGGVVSTAIPQAAPGEPTIVIVYTGSSWTEVRDATGKILLSLTGSPGMTQSVTGKPPFDVVIGSVAAVNMRYRGSPVDLAPYARANVARLRLD